MYQLRVHGWVAASEFLPCFFLRRVGAWHIIVLLLKSHPRKTYD